MTRAGSVRQTPNHRPVISVVRAVIVVPYRLIRGVDPVVVLGGLVGDVGGGADAFAAQSWSAAFPAGRRGGAAEHGVAAGPGGHRDVLTQSGEVSGAVCGVADEVDCPGGEGLCDLVEEVAAEVGFAAAALGAQGEQDGQRDRAPAERQGDHDRQDDPAVAVADLLGAGGGAVVPPGRGEDFRSASSGQGFVDGELDRRVGREQQFHDQVGQDQADLTDVPAGSGEESVGAGMVPHAGQARAGQHSTDRPFHRAEDETDEHRGEHFISWRGEAGPETVQQRLQGIGYTDLGGHWWNTPVHWRCC